MRPATKVRIEDGRLDIHAVTAIYLGSDGDATKMLYDRLRDLGPLGLVAMNLFRAQKASERAKRYRGGSGGQSYRSMAYEKKQWSIENLAAALDLHGAGLGISWGWGRDDTVPDHSVVFYIETPAGQVSFHTATRGAGPDFPGAWDGVKKASAQRTCSWVARIFKESL